MYRVYGKANCHYCTKAIELLKQKNLEFRYIQVGVEIDVDELRDKCPQPVRSVPQIFFADRYIGGFTELQREIEAIE